MNRFMFICRIMFCISVSLGGTCDFASAGPGAAQLATDDTLARVVVNDNRLFLTVLQHPASQRNWIANSPSPMPVVPFIETGTTAAGPTQLNWKYVGSSYLNGIPRRYVFTFVSATLPLELKSIWKAHDGPGPIEHSIEIRNSGQQPIVLPLQPTLTFLASRPSNHHLEHFWVEKGANRPTPYGAHTSPITPTYVSNLVSLPYAREGDRERDPIPWSVVHDVDGEEGWYAGIESSARVHIALQSSGIGIDFEAGLDRNPAQASEYSTRLEPGATLYVPTVFVGCYMGSVDDGANRMHRWLESSLRPSVHDQNYPLLVNNTWGYGMNIDEARVRAAINDSVLLGFDMVHIDAGWFRGVGDWQPDPIKFPHGIAPLADYTHSKGLKFGLWVGWTQGGASRRSGISDRPLSVFDAGMAHWFTRDYPANWKPDPFTGADVCLGAPPAVEWCLSALERIVRDYRLDLLEHDQRMIVDSCDRSDHRHTDSATDIAYQAAQGYYYVYDQLRAKHSALLFENCVNGGHTVDYGILQRTHYVSITDTYDPLSNRRAFYDASYALPPSMCECYIDQQPVKTLDEFRSMLRSGMMGWCTVMCDTLHWTVEQREAAKRQFEVYKTWLRPLIAGGSVYHVSPRPDGVQWDGMQYYDPRTGHGVLFAFRGTVDTHEHTFVCKGLDPLSTYRVSYEDQTLPASERSGAVLMREGIKVRLASPQTSDIVYVERIAKG